MTQSPTRQLKIRPNPTRHDTHDVPHWDMHPLVYPQSLFLLQEVAHECQGRSDVVIAKMDVTDQQETPATYNVTVFPTLIFFPKGNGTPQRFNGRLKHEILEFVLSGGTVAQKDAYAYVHDTRAECHKDERLWQPWEEVLHNLTRHDMSSNEGYVNLPDGHTLECPLKEVVHFCLSKFETDEERKEFRTFARLLEVVVRHQIVDLVGEIMHNYMICSPTEAGSPPSLRHPPTVCSGGLSSKYI